MNESMDYELAKKLQDARFPEDYNREIMRNPVEPGVFCYVPTLSELIEACGTHFTMEECSDDTHIELGKSKWYAEKRGGIKPPRGYGETPSEAVANLWLALHAQEGDGKMGESRNT